MANRSDVYYFLARQNAIDLDQALIQRQLALGTTESLERAQAVYSNGAFSKPVAHVFLENDGLAWNTEKGSEVFGPSFENLWETRGFTKHDYAQFSKTVQIVYETNLDQENYVDCKVGANPSPTTRGCKFAVSPDVLVGASA